MIDTLRNGFLAGGNWIVDRPKIIDVYPAQDTLANILQGTSSNGGNPYNSLLDLPGLQAPFPLEALGLIGEDEADEFIRADCRAHGHPHRAWRRGRPGGRTRSRPGIVESLRGRMAGDPFSCGRHRPGSERPRTGARQLHTAMRALLVPLSGWIRQRCESLPPSNVRFSSESFSLVRL
jgi:hypothetical protein